MCQRRTASRHEELSDDQSRTIGVRLKASDVVPLNMRLKQEGFETLGDMVKAYTSGVIGNKQLVKPLADELSSQILDKL